MDPVTRRKCSLTPDGIMFSLKSLGGTGRLRLPAQPHLVPKAGCPTPAS